MEYEILDIGNIELKSANYYCPSTDNGCGNLLCLNGSCQGGSPGNSFPCTNPGFGCRNGCGGATASMCARPWSINNR